MGRRKFTVPVVQDRPGQVIRPNTWYDIILNAVPYDRWVKTMDLYCALDNERLDFKVCQQYLLALNKRGFIERKRPNHADQFAHRRKTLVLEASSEIGEF